MSRTYSLGLKITAVVAVFVAGYAATVVLGVIGDQRRTRTLEILAEAQVPGTLAVREARFAFDAALAGQQTAMMTGEAEELNHSLAHAEQTIRLLAEAAKNALEAGRAVDELRAVEEAVRAFSNEAPPLFNLVSSRGPADPEAAQRMAALAELNQRTVAALVQLDKDQIAALTTQLRGLQSTASRQQLLNYTVFGVSLLAGGLAAYGLARFQIIKPVLRLSSSLGDESTGIRDAAEQLSAASVSLAEGASRSAAALETSSAALEQLNGMTAANAERAGQARDLSAKARDAADHGSSGMIELRTAMDAISAASNNVAAILKTIDEIAFQTTILALNAAVEAARAGSAGAGFAVVADEVRALAQRSAAAARETAAKIEDSQARSACGVQLTEKVDSNLADIASRVRAVADLVAQIATASDEQRSGLAQISSSVGELDQFTQQNAALAEQTSASATELIQRTDALLSLSASLNILAKGGNARSVVAADHPAVPVRAHPPRLQS